MTSDSARGGGTSARVRPWMCGTVVVIDLIGPITGPEVLALRRSLTTALAQRSVPLVVLNARRAGEIDPEALLVVAAAGRHTREAGGRLIVAGGPDTARPLDDVERRATLEEALAELARAKP
ncbi:hypothetical protein AB0L44_17955 [Nonomuraea wenchangensis]|uniref:hypothetical protein n=1 Tax=Nonomuraea wenchangensis TaxID=568860 RepID=UPI0034409706